MDAAILVKGVPDAIYQSFGTEQEARSRFEEAYRKGNTRIVLETTPRSQRRAEREAPVTLVAEAVYTVESTASPPSGSSNHPGGSRAGSDQLTTAYHSAREHSRTPNTIRNGPSQPIVAPPNFSSSSTFPTALQHARTERRHQLIETLFEQHQGDGGYGQGASNTRNGYGHTAVTAAGPDDVGARATSSPVSDRGHRVAPASRPSTSTRTESVRSTSPSTDSDSQPKIVVKTPSWLGQYPKEPKDSPSLVSSGLLSPLPATNFPLNSAMGRSHTAPSTPRGRQVPNMMGSPAMHRYLRAQHYPDRPTTQSAIMDPRSPIDSHASVPELTYVQYVFFT